MTARGEARQVIAARDARVTAAAYRSAAAVAEMLGNGFYRKAEIGQGNGAMAVATELRARADQMEQQ